MLAGTCKVYLAGRPMAHPSIAASAEQSSMVAPLYVLFDVAASYSTCRIICSPERMKRRSKPHSMVKRIQGGMNVRQCGTAMLYANTIYHLASALFFFCASHNLCMIFHDPDHWFASHARPAVNHARDLGFNLIPRLPETCLITYTHRSL